MLAALGDGTTAELWRRVDRLTDLLTPEAVADRAWRLTLARRIRRRADALQREMAAAGVLYSPGPLHLVRIATKKLRYGVELAGELRLGATAATLRALKKQQELLGTIHDLEVLTAFADQAIAEMPGRVRPARLVGDWHRECRELHAGYLHSRATLGRLAEAAGETLAVKVAGPRVVVPGVRRRGGAHAR
jgi:CHAD domain-containing protein